MTLVDTSVWVNHFRRGDARLVHLLDEGTAGLHAFVLGEIAAGNLEKRAETLSYLACLPQVGLAQDSEVHHLLESRRLWGRGLGWVDLHLLASAKVFGWSLYTSDQALHTDADLLGVEPAAG